MKWIALVSLCSCGDVPSNSGGEENTATSPTSEPTFEDYSISAGEIAFPQMSRPQVRTAIYEYGELINQVQKSHSHLLIQQSAEKILGDISRDSDTLFAVITRARFCAKKTEEYRDGRGNCAMEYYFCELLRFSAETILEARGLLTIPKTLTPPEITERTMAERADKITPQEKRLKAEIKTRLRAENH